MPIVVGAAAILDLQSLLSPIGDAAPCGRDPRLDTSPVSPYQVMKDARRDAADQDRAFERGFATAEETRAAQQAQRRSWATILQRGPEILGSVGKDFEIAVWLTEGLLRLHGLAGLRDGLDLTAGLVEQYWDGMFPGPELDEDAAEARLVPILALAGSVRECRLVPALRRVGLSDAENGDPVTLWELDRAAPAAADGAAAVAIDARLERSSPEFMRDLADDAQACLGAVARLGTALDARCGAAAAPGFSGLKEMVERIALAIARYVPVTAASGAEPAAEPAPAPESAEAGEAPAASVPPARAAGPAPLDRSTALRQLLEIAQFFRRTEPHSPLAYAIENLVRRGQLTLPELIEELIDDDGARQKYYITAGILPPQNKTS